MTTIHSYQQVSVHTSQNNLQVNHVITRFFLFYLLY